MQNLRLGCPCKMSADGKITRVVKYFKFLNYKIVKALTEVEILLFKKSEFNERNKIHTETVKASQNFMSFQCW